MRKILFGVFFLVLILPTVWQTFQPGFFSMHDDLQVMRIFQMERCLEDGQIPCRWSPDMGYGFGQAMFNFYSAFPYYLGILLKLISPLSIIGSVKALFFIAIFASGIGMFLLSKKFFGYWGGLLSAILYVYAPYHALDIYVRGAMSESFALAIIPFMWLFLYELILKPNIKHILLFALSLGAFLTTHNLSTMLWALPTAIWALFWLFNYRENLFKKVLSLGVSGVLGIGLASFFLLPIIFETSLIQSEFLTVNYLNYENHFVSIRQLFFDRSWGYGPSIFGDTDDISFQIGTLHWIIGIGTGLLVIKQLVQKRLNKQVLMLAMLLGFAGVTAFLSHSKSLFFWKAFETNMAFVQFPWRFLGLVMFFLSFAGGAIVSHTKLVKPIVATTLILIAILLNYGYFKPLYYFPEETDQTKLSGELFTIQSKAAILDYLPKTAQMAPEWPAGEPSVGEGIGQISNFIYRSNYFFFDAEMYMDGTVDIPVTYFPGWVVLDNDKEIYARPDGIIGTIYVDLPEGKHMIKGRFTNTPVREKANLISIVSLASVLGLFIFKEKLDKKWLA